MEGEGPRREHRTSALATGWRVFTQPLVTSRREEPRDAIKLDEEAGLDCLLVFLHIGPRIGHGVTGKRRTDPFCHKVRTFIPANGTLAGSKGLRLAAGRRNSSQMPLYTEGVFGLSVTGTGRKAPLVSQSAIGDPRFTTGRSPSKRSLHIAAGFGAVVTGRWFVRGALSQQRGFT